MNYIVAYDICDGRRLRSIFRLLKRYGLHQEKSVFLCSLSPQQTEKLCEELYSLSAKEDLILLFPVADLTACIPLRGELQVMSQEDIYY